MYVQSIAVAAFAAGAAAAACKGSSVEFGVNLISCTKPGTIALTYDDGPFDFTSTLLATLAPTKHKVTFFVNGANYAPIAGYASVVQAAVKAGHQIASHTYGHKNLTELSEADITKQIVDLEAELANIIGVWPTWIRPPFLEIGGVALPTLAKLGYHVVGTDIDTKDYENTKAEDTDKSVANFQAGLAAGGSNILAHDVHENTVKNLTPKLLALLDAKGLVSVPIGECFGDEPKYWYRTKR